MLIRIELGGDVLGRLVVSVEVVGGGRIAIELENAVDEFCCCVAPAQGHMFSCSRRRDDDAFG